MPLGCASSVVSSQHTPTKAVRLDPDYEWRCLIMEKKVAITQLLHDEYRDAKSQIEAINSLLLQKAIQELEEALALCQGRERSAMCCTVWRCVCACLCRLIILIFKSLKFRSLDHHMSRKSYAP